MLAQDTTFERHYSVEELAEAWGMSDDFVRRLFLREPGVVVFFNHRPGKRVYRVLRIPESVAQRVHRRMRPVGGLAT
jgi:transcriptional regulator GlxA family with amidase domain